MNPAEPEPPHPLSVLAGAALPARVRALGWRMDAAQRGAVERLAEPVRHGVYLWGPVGRGKTVLAEQYLAAMSPAPVLRVHLHEFFRRLQRALFGEGRGLMAAIDAVVGDAQAVLLDEFHVHDVADAVYLTAVLRRLGERDVLLLATSNHAPSELYPDPLHHHRFLPAIALIEQTLTVIPIGDGRDHRGVTTGARGFGAGRWQVASAMTSMDPRTGIDTVELDADGVTMRAAAVANASARFRFADLCEEALGAQQYLWLAERFTELDLVEMPDPALFRREPAHRFALLVDILHDRDVTLRVEAAGLPDRLADAAVPPRDLARVRSRLSRLPIC